SGRLTRRSFIGKAAALGASASVLSGVTFASRAAAQDAAYDPMKYAGTTINIMVTGDENDHRALKDLVPQLKAETGIDLVISAPALADQIAKIAQDLAAPVAPFDLYEYLGFLTTSYMSAGRFLQLNDLLND